MPTVPDTGFFTLPRSSYTPDLDLGNPYRLLSVFDVTSLLAGILFGFPLVLTAFRPGLLVASTTFSLGFPCFLPALLAYITRFPSLLGLLCCVTRHW